MRRAPRALRLGASIFRIQAAQSLQYRVSSYSGIIVGVFFALIELVILRVFYLYSANPDAGVAAGLTLSQAVSYIWLAQIFWVIQQMNLDPDLLGKINTGDIAIELCRPVDFYLHWFSRGIANSVSPLLFRGIPTLLVALLMPSGFRLEAPASLEALLLMALSIVFSLFLVAAYSMLALTVRLNVRWGDGPMYIVFLISGVLSGAYLPLQLWPQFLQRFLILQPFAGHLDIPARLYLGTIPVQDAAYALGIQLFWILAFIGIGRVLLRQKLKNIIVQGG